MTDDDDDEVARVDEIADETTRTAAASDANRKFVYHPYYGFVPVPDSSKNEKKTYVYDPYRGFVPAGADDKGSKDADRPEYHYDPRYGFMPAVDSKPKKYVQLSYFGFVSEAKAEELGVSVDSLPKYVYSSIYGYVSEKAVEDEKADANTKEVKVDEDGDVLTRANIPKDDDAKESVDVDTKEAREKFYYHPYKGFVKVEEGKEPEKVKFSYNGLYGYHPILKDTDDKGNPRKRFTYHPFNGYTMVKDDAEEKADDDDDDGMKKKKQPQREFYYDAKFGFVPVKTKSSNDDDDEAAEFFLDPFNGYIPVKDKSGKEAPQRLFVYSAYYGYIPDTADGKRTKVPTRPYYLPYTSGLNPYYYPYNSYNPYYSPEIDLKLPVLKRLEAKAESRMLAEEAAAEAGEVPAVEDDEPSRRKRSSGVLPASPYVVYAGASPAGLQAPSAVFYQPQHYYRLFSTVQIPPPYIAQAEAEPETPKSEETATTVEPEAESATNFPFVPPGAVVAQQPLPENQFPLFPYDPEQDQPAAVQF